MKRLILVTALLGLAACGSDGNNGPSLTETAAPDPTPAPLPPPAPPEENASYEVSVTNLTLAQPLSPLAVLIHDDSVRAFYIGAAASNGLEILAEGGDNSQLLNEVNATSEAGGEAPVGPGASDSLTVELPSSDTSGQHLSVVSMLVNTNDAFTAVNALDISGLAVGESITVNGVAYDSGTEANTEAAATMPGPAGGGEGFNAARDDIRDQVSMHSGVVTADDGLTSSDLGQQHRWDNPVARISITRTQ